MSLVSVSRLQRPGLAALAILLAACQPKQAAVNPDDPAIVATIDSAIQAAMAGAAGVNAEQALSITTRDSEFTFLTGDVMLTDYERILPAFRKTYGGLSSQRTDILERRIRVLAPDIAVFSAVGEGTYTDKAGFTSEPVGIGATIIFVKRDGVWRAVHIHQSIAR
jgi:uncharacterized protein (TIGR02246 family)